MKWYDLDCLQGSCIKYSSESGEDGLLKYIFDIIICEGLLPDITNIKKDNSK